jgi:hypothetical protein
VQPRNLVLAGLAVVVAGIMFALFFAVRGGPPTVASADLEAARARHQAQASASVTAPPAEREEGTRHFEPRARPSRIREPLPHAEGERPDVPLPPAYVPAERPALVTSEPEPALDSQMALSSKLDEANRLYDKADYETAQQRAIEALREAPDNVRMMRIVVSTSCMMGEEEQAKKYYGTLPERDKIQMSTRCERYGIKFD